MKGDIVIARASGNKPIVRRVWGIGSGVVFLSSERVYQLLLVDEKANVPIAVRFPQKDVFCYDEKLLQDISRQHEKNPTVWGQLKRYQWSESNNG